MNTMEYVQCIYYIFSIIQKNKENFIRFKKEKNKQLIKFRNIVENFVGKKK